MSVFTLNIIIASAHLLPVFLTSDACNIIIMMMGATIAVMVVSEVSRKVFNKLKYRKRGMRSMMTIKEWIKSSIKFDTDHQLNPGQHRPKQTNKQTDKIKIAVAGDTLPQRGEDTPFASAISAPDAYSAPRILF